MRKTHILGTRTGFSMVEMTLAVGIGLILLSVSARAMGPVRDASAVRSGDQVVRGMLSRTRAVAMERGETVRLQVDPTGDTAWVQAGADQVERYDFQEELGVDLLSSTRVTVCMTASGVADANCNYPSIGLIGLQAGSSRRYLRILPSGQIVVP